MTDLKKAIADAAEAGLVVHSLPQWKAHLSHTTLWLVGVSTATFVGGVGIGFGLCFLFG